MGWFLSNGSGSKTKKKTRRGSKKAKAGWDPQRTLMGLKVLGVAAGAVALVLGWTATERVLGRYATDHRAAAVDAGSVQLIDAPEWLEPAVRQRLQVLTAKPIGSDPLQRDGLLEAARSLKADPWIAEVNQVRRVPGGVVQVEADYRTPAAVVAGSRGYHLVDRQGVWLEDLEDREGSRWNRMPLITGLTPDALSAPRRRWAGESFDAALDLAETLATEPYADQVTAIDVSHRDLKGRLWLVLYTDGPAIIWGLPPGQEQSIEPDAAVKLGALRDWAYAQGGRIDARGTADFVWVYTGTAQVDARPNTVTANR